MTWYLTGYRANWVPVAANHDATRPGNYSGYLWATSSRQATRVAQMRGLGELVIGAICRPKLYRTASSLLKARRAGPKHEREMLHGLCFLGMLALASGEATVQEVLGDQGILHSFAHDGRDMKKIIARVQEIERRVPGYLPTSRKYPYA